MKFSETRLHGAALIESKIFEDQRGCFFESWNQSAWHKYFAERGEEVPVFVQDNHSISAKGVLRGMHFQVLPHEQGKLVRCVSGVIYDVIVDLRRQSPTFKQWQGFYLSAKNQVQLWVPSGFAHGFLALEDQTAVIYKVTQFWNQHAERSLYWQDPELAITWPFEKMSDQQGNTENIQQRIYQTHAQRDKMEYPHQFSYPCVSVKDAQAPCLRQLSEFEFF